MPAALAVSGTATAVPAAAVMKVRRLNPDGVDERRRSVIDGLRRMLVERRTPATVSINKALLRMFRIG
jgi:hypothetical protein